MCINLEVKEGRELVLNSKWAYFRKNMLMLTPTHIVEVQKTMMFSLPSRWYRMFLPAVLFLFHMHTCMWFADVQHISSQLVHLLTIMDSFILRWSFEVFWGSAILLLFNSERVLLSRLDWDQSYSLVPRRPFEEEEEEGTGHTVCTRAKFTENFLV